MSEDQSPVDDLFGDEGIRIESEDPEVRRPKAESPVKGWMLGAGVLGLALSGGGQATTTTGSI